MLYLLDEFLLFVVVIAINIITFRLLLLLLLEVEPRCIVSFFVQPRGLVSNCRNNLFAYGARLLKFNLVH